MGAGEVHIERCLTDLRTQFAPNISIRVSPPIIPFRETIVEPPKVDLANEAIGEENKLAKRDIYLLPGDVDVDDDCRVTVTTSGKRWSMTFRASPLPTKATRLLSERATLLRAVSQREHPGSRNVNEEGVAALLPNEANLALPVSPPCLSPQARRTCVAGRG